MTSENMAKEFLDEQRKCYRLTHRNCSCTEALSKLLNQVAEQSANECCDLFIAQTRNDTNPLVANFSKRVAESIRKLKSKGEAK